MAHDLYVGVIREDHVSPGEQVKAARIATVIVGAMAITIGILSKGQNVAHLVALAFAVASSANFPCVLLTLFWKRCNTGGIVLGMVVGTLTAIGLVMVSPNLTYPRFQWPRFHVEAELKFAEGRISEGLQIARDAAALEPPAFGSEYLAARLARFTCRP
jgi:Na+(H+)/acetate symporter ActP